MVEGKGWGFQREVSSWAWALGSRLTFFFFPFFLTPEFQRAVVIVPLFLFFLFFPRGRKSARALSAMNELGPRFWKRLPEVLPDGAQKSLTEEGAREKHGLDIKRML